MIHYFFGILSILVLISTFYLRLETGTAGWLSLAAIASLFYLVIFSTYLLDSKKRAKRN